MTASERAAKIRKTKSESPRRPDSSGSLFESSGSGSGFESLVEVPCEDISLVETACEDSQPPVPSSPVRDSKPLGAVSQDLLDMLMDAPGHGDSQDLLRDSQDLLRDSPSPEASTPSVLAFTPSLLASTPPIPAPSVPAPSPTPPPAVPHSWDGATAAPSSPCWDAMVETLPPTVDDGPTASSPDPSTMVPQEERQLGSMYVQSCVELAEDFERVGLAAMPPQLVQIAANLVLKGFNRTTLLGHISRRDLRATGDMNTLRLRLLMHDGWGAKRWGPDVAQALDLSGIRLSSIDEDVACAAGPSDPTLAASPESIQADMQPASHSDGLPTSGGP